MITGLFQIPQVASMLGVSTYAAQKIVDAIFIGASIWKIVSLIVACGATFAFGMLMVKKLTKALGRAAAVAW